jgi:AcrR family transcriptional regulator
VTGLRERKKRQTYELLRRVTVEMTAAQGFGETTVEQIADVADVSPRTFFRYFATKREALLADQSLRLSALRELLRSRPPSEPVLDSICAVLRFLQQDANDQRETLLLQLRVARSDPEVLAHLLAHHVTVQQTLHAFVAAKVHGDPFGIRTHTLSDVPFAIFCDRLRAWLLSGAPQSLDVPVDELLEQMRVSTTEA